jgi:3-oxoacyl-[acyl-carrier protein] reductase
MPDLLVQLHQHPLTTRLVKAIGLPDPVALEREAGAYVEQPFAGKIALCHATSNGFAEAALRDTLGAGGARFSNSPEDAIDIVVLDATHCSAPADLRVLYEAFHPLMRRIAQNGRVLIVAPLIAEAGDAVAAGTARGIEGFSRSLGKELGSRGTTVNLVYLARQALDRLPGAVRFFCGKQTTYVSGQAVTVTAQVKAPAATPWTRVLAGKTALVTGSARGIGLATAQRLAQEGARVICLDVPAMGAELRRACAGFGGTPLELDITTSDAPRVLADFLKTTCNGVDVVVHNAGVTRDKTLANMKEAFWDLVVSINFAAIAAIDQMLTSQQVLREGGRIVCLSSISGIAGNFGQTNYATTKAALIGYVAAQAPRLAPLGISINAVAPGFIETPMTAEMPFVPREIGRRLNAVKQSGLPPDAAELITFLSSPGASGITGNTIRVCGQGMIGA